ncbi:hypothetical protein BSNK01_08650 [Bacillaceae bacterium]
MEKSLEATVRRVVREEVGPLFEELRSLVKTNLEGQRAFEERFDRRLTRLEKAVESLKQDRDLIISQLNVVQKDVAVLKQDVAVLKEDVAVLKRDVAVLKEDVAVLKQDVAVLKEDVAVLKQDVSVLKQDVSSLKKGQKNMEASFEFLAGEYGKQKMQLEMVKEMIFTRHGE